VAQEGLEELGERVEALFAENLQRVELLLPFAEGGRLAELHELDGELEREDTPDGVRVQARLPAAVAARYGRWATNGARL
jgi:GTP-binding protein HflX